MPLDSEVAFRTGIPFFKRDGKAIQYGFPVPYLHRPLLAAMVQCKINQFAHGFIGRKATTGFFACP